MAQCIGRAHRPAAMGSLGWAQCYWCRRWAYNMYIPDGINGALCGDCLDLQRPPYRPDLVDRVTANLMLSIGIKLEDREVVFAIADMLVGHWDP